MFPKCKKKTKKTQEIDQLRRHTEKFIVFKYKNERLKNSAIPYMQILLNKGGF